MTLHKVYLIGLVQALKCTVRTISCTVTMGKHFTTIPLISLSACAVCSSSPTIVNPASSLLWETILVPVFSIISCSIRPPFPITRPFRLTGTSTNLLSSLLCSRRLSYHNLTILIGQRNPLSETEIHILC